MDEHDDEPPMIRHELAAHPAFGLMIRDIEAAALILPDRERQWQTSQAIEVVEATITATHDNPWEVDNNDQRKISLWSHRSQPVLARKKHGEPYISIRDVQSAAAGYLYLNFRVDRLDRLLVDMLIAAEMFAYADTPGIQAELRRVLPHPLKWLLSNLITLIVGAAIAGAVLWLTSASTVGGWVAAIVMGVAVILSVYSLVAFPFFYPQLRKHSIAVRECLTAMRDTYVSLNGYPASVKHVMELIEKAAKRGVVWPSQLYVLMEDIQSRRKAI